MNLVYDLGTLHVPVFVIDIEPGPRFRVFGMNVAAEKELGQPSSSLAGRLFEDCVPPNTARMLTERYAVCVRTRQSMQFDEKGEMSPTGDWYRTTLSPSTDPVTGEVVRILTICQNITQTKRLATAAFEDPLTGLLNRRGFDRTVADRCDEAVYSNEGFSLVVVDLDDLKDINDTYGHRVGDEAIRRVGSALRDFLNPGEVVARVGGDEFYMLLQASKRDRLDHRLDFMRGIVALGLHVPGLRSPIGLSAGGAVCLPGEDAYEVLSRADAEMYAAKAVGRLTAMRPSESASRKAKR